MELLGKSKQELREYFLGLGEPAYRSDQLYHALYARRQFDLAGISNLPAALRERLAQQARLSLPRIERRFASSDGSLRYLFSLPAGEDQLTARAASVEAVFMPSDGRQTICVSTQAGCAVDCQFCLTARLGLIRNLTAGEILAQVLVPLQENQERLAPQTNVVLMGQGEPLLNFPNVMAALRILLDEEGVAISPKHVTLSTSGIVPGIEKLAMEPLRPKLAISLNASSDEQRDLLMPINRKYPLSLLLAACKNTAQLGAPHLRVRAARRRERPAGGCPAGRQVAGTPAVGEGQCDPLESRRTALSRAVRGGHRRVSPHPGRQERAGVCSLFARPRRHGRLRPTRLTRNRQFVAGGPCP